MSDDYTQLENRYRVLRDFVVQLASYRYISAKPESIAQIADNVLVKIGEWEPEK